MNTYQSLEQLKGRLSPKRFDSMPNTANIGWALVFSAWLIGFISPFEGLTQ